MLKVNLIRRLLDNIILKSNYQNSDIGDLPFGGDEKLIFIQRLYYINDNTVFWIINGLSNYI